MPDPRSIDPKPSQFVARRLEAALLAALAVGIAVLLAAPIHRVFLEVPGDSNEGWNAYHALLALSGGVLYPPMDSFISTNYPPLSFFIVGGLGRWLGDDIIAGRLIALASLLAVAVSVFLLTRLLGGRSFFAAVAALLFLFYFGIHAAPYVAMDDPQLLGHAFITLGAWCFFEARSSARPWPRILLSSLCCVAGVMIKQNLIVLPLALFLWSVLYERRLALRWTSASLILGLGAMALAVAVYGPHMLPGIFLHQRVMSLHILEYNIVRFIVPLMPLVTLAVLLGAAAWRKPPVVFALIYAAVAGALGLFFLTGRGCDVNIVFDLAIALCLCAGLAGEEALSALGGRARPWAPAAIGWVIASGCTPGFAAALADAAGSLRDEDSMRRDYAELIAQIAASPGPVACEMLSLCYWAHRDFDIDTHNYLQKMLKGSVDPSALKQRIDERYYAYIQATAPPKRSSLPTATMFGEELSREVEQHYKFVRRVGDDVLLAPRP
jgi:MFS family permease